MKHRIFILCFCSALFISCGNSYDEINDIKYKAEKETTIETRLSSSVVNSVVNNIGILLSQEISSRAVGGGIVLTEEEAKKQLEPFVEEGKRLRDEILVDMRANPTAYPTGSGLELMNMTDDQLAEFGFTVYEYETNPKIIMYGTNQWTDCILEAFGISKNVFKYISNTHKLMTARTGFMIAKAFAKRTLGWIGAAIAIYEYTQCMNG